MQIIDNVKSNYNIIIRDGEVGNLHLMLGAYSLHIIIYFGTSDQKKNESGNVQTYRNQVST